MITGRIFVQFARKKERQTGREVRKKRRELRDRVYPTNSPAQNDAHQTQERTTYRPFSPASKKRRRSCPGHRCFEKFISHQLGLSRPTLPNLRHLLTKQAAPAEPICHHQVLPRFQLAAHTCTHSQTPTIQLLQPQRSGSSRQLLG